jgi:hypothetical protein
VPRAVAGSRPEEEINLSLWVPRHWDPDATMPAPQILSFVSSFAGSPCITCRAGHTTHYVQYQYIPRPQSPQLPPPNSPGRPSNGAASEACSVCGRPPRAPSWHKWRRIIIDLVLVVSSVSSRLFPSRPRNAREAGGWLPKHFAIRHRSSYGISRDGMGTVPRGKREVPGTS